MTPDDTPDTKGSEQGAVGDEPRAIGAEDVVGGQERPNADQLSREQQIVDEAPDESQQRLAGQTGPADFDSQAALGPHDAAPGMPPADEADDDTGAPRSKPEIPGADLTPDIVLEGDDPLGREGEGDEDDDARSDDDDEDFTQPIAATAISLAAGARYAATGKRKSAVARVILRPGTGTYTVNSRTLEVHLPRLTLQRQVRSALETVGLEEKIDVVASIHGGGVSAQAGALRHGISRALVDADPNLRSELKRRGFLTRDARVKERKKAGLKKARKRPQFSKR